jgi:hypothetical protein
MTQQRPVGSWAEQQQNLIEQRRAINADNDMRAYEAGRLRGSRGEIETPPWVGHLHEIAPGLSPLRAQQQIVAPMRYGQTEAYIEGSHDLLEDEFRPRAEKLANEGRRAQTRLESAATTYKARGMVAAVGRSRYPIAPTARRVRVAQSGVAEVQGRSDALQQELQGRLDEVDKLREGLAQSPWKPRHH